MKKPGTPPEVGSALAEALRHRSGALFPNGQRQPGGRLPFALLLSGDWRRPIRPSSPVRLRPGSSVVPWLDYTVGCPTLSKEIGIDVEALPSAPLRTRCSCNSCRRALQEEFTPPCPANLGSPMTPSRLLKPIDSSRGIGIPSEREGGRGSLKKLTCQSFGFFPG